MVLIDGTLIRTQRRAGRADRRNYSGKHRSHGLHVLALTDEKGHLIWISVGIRAGRRKTACQAHSEEPPAMRARRACSPRPRGWSLPPFGLSYGPGLLPAPAGMVPWACCGPLQTVCAPRVRGDGPRPQGHSRARTGPPVAPRGGQARAEGHDVPAGRPPGTQGAAAPTAHTNRHGVPTPPRCRMQFR
ncbi:transposase family protein [Streptomyces sp. NPDC056165]|uniref:transposase family protein n=1 Tax=Streptomyces sp. NPDC056165 TaxID=3345733 RepID=UPI0035DE9F93